MISPEFSPLSVFSFDNAMAALLPDATVQLLPGHVRQHPQAQWLVGIKPYTDNHSVHSQHWERHPCGDEMLTLLEGRLNLIVQAEDAQQHSQTLLAGQSVLIPQGCWHRLEVLTPGKLMFITPTTNSEHRHVHADD